MKKSVKKIFIVITMIALMLCCGVTTQAKTKKLKVNAVYTNAKKVRGTTRLKKAKVVAKVGKKTYRTRSNRKGKYTINIKKKRKKGTKIKVTVYRKKKVYAKKTVKVKTPKLIYSAKEGSTKITGTTLKNAKVVLITSAFGNPKTYGLSDSKGKFSFNVKQISLSDNQTEWKIRVYDKKNKLYAKTTWIKVTPYQWWKKKPFKGHKAAICGVEEDEAYKKVPNQYTNGFICYVKKGYWAKFFCGTKKNYYTILKGSIKKEIFIFHPEYPLFPHKAGEKQEPIGNRKIKINIYRNRDNKLIDSYSITPRKVKQPGKTDEINYAQFLKDYRKVEKNGKKIVKTIGDYYYNIDKDVPSYGVAYTVGHPGYYYDVSANGVHVKITALHGATLYITVGAKANFNFPAPSPDKYDVMIKPGKTYKWEGADFKEGELIDQHLMEKIYAYKNGKLVYMEATMDYLIQGYSDNDKWFIMK